MPGSAARVTAAARNWPHRKPACAPTANPGVVQWGNHCASPTPHTIVKALLDGVLLSLIEALAVASIEVALPACGCFVLQLVTIVCPYIVVLHCGIYRAALDGGAAMCINRNVQLDADVSRSKHAQLAC